MFFHKKRSLFRAGIEPRCAYCARATPLSDDTVACKRRGVTRMEDHCRAFRYDPLRRTPPKPAVLRGHFTNADFSLEDLGDRYDDQ